MEIVPSAYDTASMIVDTVQLNLMNIGSKRIEFKLSVNDNLPDRLVGDEVRVKQVLNNIISNAFKYTQEGSVNLRFDAAPISERDEITMVVTVTDSGQGLTQTQIDDLFGEFTRFNLKSNRSVEGSGLGLVIAHELVLMMGGKIEVESEVGIGSKFTIYLPQKKFGDGVLGAELVSKMQNLKDTQRTLKKITKLIREPMPYGRVLVVDAVESNLYVAKSFLIPYKLSVETVGSAVLAIEKVKAGKVYDIIFMDHMMPDMDGIEATKLIRSLGYDHPIIALTANALSDSVKLFMENGFSGYISKPIDINQLDNYLLNFIRDKQPPEVIEQSKNKYNYAPDDKSAIGNDLPQMLVDSFLRDAAASHRLMHKLSSQLMLDDNELKSITIQAHAMKSALQNIGKSELSRAAGALESAARMGDLVFINEKTPAFLNKLHDVINNLIVKQGLSLADEDEDPAFVKEQLLVIKAACESCNTDIADSAISAIREKTCSRQTQELLVKVADLLLCFELEEAAALISRSIV
jgi:CheY-like chemotaxis protein